MLRALQEGEIDPVGSKRPVKVNFRLISATNRDMIQQVKDGKFREDLYYRLNVFPISVPPLRERNEDIPELTRHFIARFAAEEGKRVTTISDRAMRLLQGPIRGPENVRQLENAVFRAVVLADGPELSVAEFPQIAAHVDGFEAEIPAAPAAVQKPQAYTGPALLGAEEYRSSYRRDEISVIGQLSGHPSRRRGWRNPLARGDRSRHDPIGARPLSRTHDRGCQASEYRPLDPLSEDAGIRARTPHQLVSRNSKLPHHADACGRTARSPQSKLHLGRCDFHQPK